MTTTPFIVVFRPHQLPAKAETYASEEEFADACGNGHFAYFCGAEPGADEDITFDAAWESAGRELHALTRLDSPEEVQRYLADRDYCGHHNRGTAAVRRAARELGWLPEPAEAE